MEEICAHEPDAFIGLTSVELRTDFFDGFDMSVAKDVFRVLNREIDLDRIFDSAASSLYCTQFANMAAYIYEYRVAPSAVPSTASEELILRNFQDIAKEPIFDLVGIADIPLRPRKRANTVYRKAWSRVTISARDPSFRFFRTPEGYMSRASGEDSPVSERDDMESHDVRTPNQRGSRDALTAANLRLLEQAEEVQESPPMSDEAGEWSETREDEESCPEGHCVCGWCKDEEIEE